MTKRNKSIKYQRISTEQLDGLVVDAIDAADSSSRIVYVYPYVESGVVNINRSINMSLKRAYVENAVKPKLKSPSNSAKRVSAEMLSELLEKKLNLKTNWAVRVEGRANPEKRVFRTIETASEYAKKLIVKGMGDELVIRNK